jgi:predicted alpha/beta-fold hydrolase
MFHSFQIRLFQPAKGIANPHMQTLLGRIARQRAGLIFHRIRLDTPDGDFIDLDIPEVPGHLPSEDAPVVLLLHGLEGNARKGYACETYRRLAQHGIRSVGMNYRSCSGVINRTPRSYHAGATEDVDFVVKKLAEWYPDVPLGAIGFSLGANLLLKYVGEKEANVLLNTAVVISPPFSLGQGASVVENGISQMYLRVFMRSLRQKVRARAKLLEGIVDIEQALAARTFREFDEAFTVPLYGFKNAADYYYYASSERYLSGIHIPTMIIRALDDPVFDRNDIPHEKLKTNNYLFTYLTKTGGHVGFVEGQPGNWYCWAEHQAARFFQCQLSYFEAPSPYW